MRPNEKKTCSDCGQEKEFLREGICEDCLAQSQYSRIVKHGFDHRDDQQLFEIYTTQDWARELTKLGHSIPIPTIKPNLDKQGEPDDPPDVLAVMNGEKIGVEVTRLFEYQTFDKAGTVYFGTERVPDEDEKKKILEKLRQQYSKKPNWRISVEWTRETFENYLTETVQKKDGKMKDGKTGKDGSLRKQFLLCVTDEIHLGEDILSDYLTGNNKITLPRPENFDAIYVMGAPVSGEKADPVEIHYPVFEVCLSDSHHQ